MEREIDDLLADLKTGCVMYAVRYCRPKGGSETKEKIDYYGPFATLDEGLDFLDDHDIEYYDSAPENAPARVHRYEDDKVVGEDDNETIGWLGCFMAYEDQEGFNIVTPFYPIDLRDTDPAGQLAVLAATFYLTGGDIGDGIAGGE